MKIELLITGDCVPCRKAEELWRQVCAEQDLTLSVLDVRDQEGKKLFFHLRLHTLPALVIEDKLVAVGVQDPEQAEELLAAARANRC